MPFETHSEYGCSSGFLPAPRFHPRPSKVNQDLFYRLIETAFSQRRKTLAHLLANDKFFKVNREKIHEMLDQMGFPEKVRGEELLLKDFLELAERLAFHAK